MYVLETIMGTDLRSQEGNSIEYVKAIYSYVKLQLLLKYVYNVLLILELLML